LVAPLESANYTAKAEISLLAAVTPNGHDISKVQFFNGTNLLGESLTEPYAYTWSGVGLGTYAVRAQLVFDSGSTLVSAPANISVTLPQPWQTLYIGDSAAEGDAWVSGSGFSVTSAGNISGSADNFRFIYQPLTNYGLVSAQLTSLMDASANTSVGLMVRDGLATGSPYVMLSIGPDNQIRWQSRATLGGSTSSQVVGVATPPNFWANLAFLEGMCYSVFSKDNTNWTVAGYVQTQFSPNSYLGLAVVSGTPTSLSPVTFTNVTLAIP